MVTIVSDPLHEVGDGDVGRLGVAVIGGAMPCMAGKTGCMQRINAQLPRK